MTNKPPNSRRKFITIFLLAAIGWALVMRGIFGVYEWVRSDKTPPPVAAQEAIDICLTLGEKYLPEGAAFGWPYANEYRYSNQSFKAWSVTARINLLENQVGAIHCTLDNRGYLTSMRFAGFDITGQIKPLPVVPPR